MQKQTFSWDEVRRIADEVEVQIHLASMEARDRWQVLKPRVLEIEKSIVAAGKRAGEAVEQEIASLGAALRRLRDDLDSIS